MPKAKSKQNKDVSTDVKQYVRKQLQANLEIKRKEYDGFATTDTNTGWVLAYPSQGLDSESRTGDAIVMKYFSINADFYSLVTAPHTYRMIVYLADASSLVTAANLFVGGPGNYLQGHVDTNYVTPIMDETLNMDAASRLSHSIRKKIKLNRKITFLLGTQTPKNEYVHIWIGSCNALGTPVTAQVRAVCNFQIGFTDA